MRGRKFRGKVQREKEKYRINDRINAREVRLIDDEGQMVGVMSSDEALRFAESRGLDLIEIAPNANPPTCKVMDYGKWKYEAKKKEKESRKNQTIVTIKEIQIRPRTDDHDLDVKLKHARKFLLEGDKVKLNLRFSGREMAHQELGYELLKDVSQRLSEIATVEAEPKKEGRQLFVLMAPDATKIKDYKKKQAATPKDGEVAEEASPAAES
ncbi:MAG: translation initiation factor IF-3 [Bdellovibrionaceae bacterium]|nr:translation initiation factor IF-3 [Pseudobdellovibrionaceae bacterium]